MITRRQAIVGVGALAMASAIPGDGVALTCMAHPDNSYPRLQAIVAEIDARFGSVEGAPYYCCATGEPYIELVSGGVREAGEPLPIVCDCPEDAIEAWALSFFAYMLKQPQYPSRLYWRSRPNVEFDISWDNNGVQHEKWTVYSRLIITDKPELPEAELQSHLDRERHAIYDARTGEYVGDIRDVQA